MKFNLKNNYPHLIAIAVFLVISIIYLSPVLSGLSLKQDDINNHKGVAKEIKDHRAEYGEEPLWTNALFGGMPATQVSVIHSSNLMNYLHKVITLGLPHPINYLFLYLLGFYIMCLCLSIRPWLSILGAIMFGLTSFFFISLQVGHNSKVMAMAYMPMIIGAFIYTFRNKSIIGAVLFALFLALELRSNHVQITYYAFMILLVIGIGEFIRFIKEKKIKSFFKRVSLLLAAGILAIFCNSGNLFMTYDYLPDSQRGPSELSNISNDKNETGGLDLDYMTNWSYGIGESINLIIPNAKGGGSGVYLLDENLMESSSVSSGLKNFIKDVYKQGWTVNTYWGNQPGTSGPVYIGATVFFLFFIGLFFLRDQIKWPLLIISITALALSWGHNLMNLTELFASYFPGYSKFRSVTMILVIVEIVVPFIGILWLYQFLEKDKGNFEGDLDFKVKIISRKKWFYIVSSVFILLLFLLMIQPSLFLNFTSINENNIITQLSLMNPQVSNYIDELVSYRESVFSSDAFRSFVLVLFLFLLVILFINKKVSKNILIAGISLIVIFDLWGVSSRYLHNDEHTSLENQLTGQSGLKHWQDKDIKLFPHMPQGADLAIRDNEISNNTELRSKIQNRMKSVFEDYSNSDHRNRIATVESFKELNFNTNYRVLEMGNPLNNARTSFLHKSIGGYSAVKIKRFQEMLDSYFQKEYGTLQNSLKNSRFDNLKSAHFLNMLNTKYFIFDLKNNGVVDLAKPINNKPGVLKNPYALGNAWSISQIKWAETADDEIAKIGDSSFEPSKSVIINSKDREEIGELNPKGMASVKMLKYKANHINYQVNANEEDFIVFSEIFYDKGWKAFIDGKQVPHYRVNYILRGIKAPIGNYLVEFKYDLPIYHSSSMISLTGSLLIIILFFGIVFFKFTGREIPEL